VCVAEFTCKAGEYLDISADQECHPCPAGQYSLGGGLRYDDWDLLPAAFSVQLQRFTSALFHPLITDDILPPSLHANCSGYSPSPAQSFVHADK